MEGKDNKQFRQVKIMKKSVQPRNLRGWTEPWVKMGNCAPVNADIAEQQRASIQDAITEHPEKSDSKTAQTDECGSGNYLIEIQRCNSCIVESPKVYPS